MCFDVFDQGIGKLSVVAQSAASVVQAGTREITSKVLIFFPPVA